MVLGAGEGRAQDLDPWRTAPQRIRTFVIVQMIALNVKRTQMDKSLGSVGASYVLYNAFLLSLYGICVRLSLPFLLCLSPFGRSYTSTVARWAFCLLSFIPFSFSRQDAYQFLHYSRCCLSNIRSCYHLKRLGFTRGFQRAISEPSTDHRTIGGSRPANWHM